MTKHRHQRSGWLATGALLAGLWPAAPAWAQWVVAPGPGPALGTGTDLLPPIVLPGNNCAKLPCGAIPAPNGTFVRMWMSRQINKAEADDFVIYKHEWYAGGQELGPYGQYHIHEIARRLARVPFPVLVQIELNPALNEARRLVVINALAQAGVADADKRVAVGFPIAEGLAGEAAPRIYLRSIQTGTGQGGGGTGGLGGSLGGAAGSTIGALGGGFR